MEDTRKRQEGRESIKGVKKRKNISGNERDE